MNEWIPLRERFPEGPGPVLISTKYHTVEIASRMRTSHYSEYQAWYGDKGRIFNDEEVTHWMPLPELPK